MKRSRIAGLDLLRGVAILLVIVRHGFPGWLPNGGIVGVGLFFALSGYLITGILQRDVAAGGRVRYRHFYRNRVVRLYPALILVVVAYAVGELTTGAIDHGRGVWKTVVVALTYTDDVPGLDDISLGLSHLWTLAVEEQFYLIWPLVLTLAIRFGRVRLTVGIVLLGALLVDVLSVAVTEPTVEHIYRVPTTWAITLLIGSASRLFEIRIQELLAGPPQVTAAIGGALVLFVISALPDAVNQGWMYIVGAPAIGLATVALIFHVRRWDALPTPVLRPLLALGTISYGAYLWNYLITTWLDLETVHSLGRGLVSAAATLAAASVSWLALERPLQRFKARLDDRGGRRELLKGRSDAT